MKGFDIVVLHPSELYLKIRINLQSRCHRPFIDPAAEYFDPFVPIVNAGNNVEIFSAIVFKIFNSLHADFLQSLQAIGNKCRGDNCHVFHTAFCKRFNGFVGVWVQPLVACQTRLERSGIAAGFQLQILGNQTSSLITLVSVAVLMRHRRGFTTRLIGLAMRFGDVGFAQMSFRNPMIGEQNVLPVFFL